MANKKNKDLPGIEGAGVAPITIPEIEEAADAYIKERDKRCALTPKEIAAKEKLINLIHTHAGALGRNGDGITIYCYDDLTIELKPGKEKLSIKAAKDIDEEE